MAYLTRFKEAPKTYLGMVRIMLGLSNKTVEDWGSKASTRPSPLSFLFSTG